MNVSSARPVVAVAIAVVAAASSVVVTSAAAAPAQVKTKVTMKALKRPCSASTSMRFKVKFTHLVPSASYIISTIVPTRDGGTTDFDTPFTATGKTFKKAHFTLSAGDKLPKKSFVANIELDQLTGPGMSVVAGAAAPKIPKCS